MKEWGNVVQMDQVTTKVERFVCGDRG